jgi:hypothetical protein
MEVSHRNMNDGTIEVSDIRESGVYGTVPS